MTANLYARAHSLAQRPRNYAGCFSQRACRDIERSGITGRRAKMGSLRKAVLVAACAAGLAAPPFAAGAPAKGQTYVLKGYKFGGKLDAANAAGIVAKLKHQPGDHVTEADIDADAASFARELKARHLMGRFFASSEEVRGGEI